MTTPRTDDPIRPGLNGPIAWLIHDGADVRVFARQYRAAAIRSSTAEPEKRTIEIVWSTGAPVRRHDWWTGQDYVEVLSMEPAAVDLSRLNGGAPVLNAHQAYDLAAVLGVIEKAWIADGEGRAIVRFSDRADVEPIWRDIVAGIIRNVSVGYDVRKYEITEEDGHDPIYTAVDWQPMEVSMVPIGADAAAGTRADNVETRPCTLVNRAPARNQETSSMSKTETRAAPQPGTETAAQPAPATAPTPVDPIKIAAEAAEAERKRGLEIRKRVDAVQLPSDVADDLIVRGVELAHVGDQIVDAIAKRGGQKPATPRIEGGHDQTDPAEIRSAMVEALATRATRNRIPMTERAQSYAGHSILEMCADLARARGEKIPNRLPPAGLYSALMGFRALSTSDFPILLADASNKVLMNAYQLANVTYRLIFGRKTFRDFKPHNFIRAGDFPVPLEKGETGEFKYGSMSEAKQAITLATWGRIIGISRRILINDDLGAFADLGTKAGRRVADFENTTAWAQLALNSGDGPTITETNRPLFNATDKTKAGSGGAIAIATVGTARAEMMKKTSLDGLKLNVMPRYLLTSPDKFTDAEQFCAVNILAAKDADANPFKGRLVPVGDANLTGNAWMMFADPMDLETLVYGYLEGAEGPQLASREGFTTDGVELRLSIDFVAGAIDFRGAWKNAGA